MGVKLGQKWAVKDGNLLASNRVGSRFFNKEFDFSRASNGTYVDRDGLLKTAELYNLLSYSEDFTQAYWTKSLGVITQSEINSPTGSINTNLFTKTSAVNTVSRITRSFPYATTGNHTFSVYIKQNVGNEVLFRFDSNGNSANATFLFDTKTITLSGANIIDSSVLELSNGWFKIVLTANILSTSWGLDIVNLYSNPTNDSVYIFGAQLVLGTEALDYQYTNGLQGLPRISFEDGVGHLLLEPQRTNKLPYSEDFQTFNKSSVTLEDGYLAPDGTNSAYKITAIDTSLAFMITSGASLADDARSIYARTVSGTGQVHLLGRSNNANCAFTLTEEWQRFEINSAINSASNFYGVDFRAAATTLSEVIIWGAQCEVGSYSTSYIKTEGTSVTRLADVCNNSGSAQDFNNEGVLYAEIAALNDEQSYRQITISDGSTSNRVSIDFISSAVETNTIRSIVNSSGSLVVNVSHQIDNVLDYNKIAFKYKENDFALWINGIEVKTDTIGAAPIGLSELAFDNGSGVNPFYGKVRNLQVFTEALSDAELQQLTT